MQQDMLVQQGALKDKSHVVSNLDRDITLCDSTLTTLQVKKSCVKKTQLLLINSHNTRFKVQLTCF